MEQNSEYQDISADMKTWDRGMEAEVMMTLRTKFIEGMVGIVEWMAYASEGYSESTTTWCHTTWLRSWQGLSAES